MLKKLLILLGALLMLTLPAFAEDIPADAVALMQSAHPRHTLTQVVSASEPVIAVMSEGEHHVLCVAEKVSGAWTLTVDNPSALWDGELPTFLWEGGMALYYSYTHDSDKVTCHAEWQNGQWGNVDMIHQDLGNHEEWSISWQEGFLYIVWQQYEADGNPVGMPKKYAPYYQPSLADKVTLADFDINAFPKTIEYVDKQEALDGIVSGYTLVDGALGTSSAAFVADAADGQRYFIGAMRYIDSSNLVWWKVTLSQPLPEETWLHGWHSNGDHVELCPYQGEEYVYVDLMRDGTWQVSYIGRKDWFSIGQNHVDLLDGVGHYAWGTLSISLDVQDITDWNALPATVKEAKALLDQSDWAVVNNPNPEDRLHLRMEPKRSARSLGKYYNGTPVHVLEKKGDWVKVDIFGVQGWMMKQYLVFGSSLNKVGNAMPVMFAREGKETVPLYWDAACTDKKGEISQVKVMGIVGDDCYHVMEEFEPDHTGYVRREDLWGGNG